MQKKGIFDENYDIPSFNKAAQYQLLKLQAMQTNQSKPINESYCINESVLLGKGSTGNVYLGFERNNPFNRVAIKVIDLRTIDNEVTRYLLSCQIAALSNLGKLANSGHQNIVKLYDIVFQDHFILLVMEHLEGGTLADYIKRHPQGLNQNEALFIFRQILEGYAHMRNKQVVHRDLKPDNILFKADPEKCKKVAIIDFGYCEMEEVPNKPQLYYNVGSPKYMSPQAYRQNNYSQKSDIWALGVIFYEMLAGKTCDHGMSMEKYLEMIQKQGIPLPPKINHFNRHILCLMLNYLHSNRLSADQILRQIDSYLNSLNHQKSEVILRTNLTDDSNRLSHDNANLKVNKNSSIFQSLIVPPSTHGVRKSFNQNSENDWDRNEYIVQRKEINHVGSRIPIIQINSKPILEGRNIFQQQQSIGKSDNVCYGSVKDIIHRKPGSNDGQNHNYPTAMRNSFLNNTIIQAPQIIPEKNDQHFNQTFPLNFQSTQTNFNIHRNMERNQGIFPQQIENVHVSSPLMANNNNLVKRVQFVNQFVQNKPYTAPVAHIQLHSIGTPSTNGIKIKINNQTPLFHIQQQKKIELDPTNESHRYHSPQKQPVTVASNVQFFTEKKVNLPQPSQSPPKPQRPIINLKPQFAGGQIKVGFTKLQPQRPLKFNQLQNQIPLMKQGFCA